MMTAVSADSLLALGFVLGLRHAVEADHLAAVSTIATERRSLLSSWLVGASWSFGHTFALLIEGVCVLVLRYRMTDRMAHVFELCVGVMLVLLGANVLRSLIQRGTGHSHAHTTIGSHSQADVWLVARPLLVGMVHGLGGSAAPHAGGRVVAVGSVLLYHGVRCRLDDRHGDHELSAQCARSLDGGPLRAHQRGIAGSLWIVQCRAWPLHRI